MEWLQTEKGKLYQRKYQYFKRMKIKREIFELLGGKCAKYGYTGPVLQIDHVNDNGNREGRSCYGYWFKVLRKIRNGSKDYQLLCANCNWEKELERRKKIYGNEYEEV